MEVNEFEDVCRRSGVNPVGAFNTGKGVIYVGEGLYLPNLTSKIEVERKKHYRVVWAIGQGGELTTGQEIKLDADRFSSQEQRVKIAHKAAMPVLERLAETPHFKKVRAYREMIH